MSLKENLKMLTIERQLAVDREKKVLEDIKPTDGIGWIFARDRLEVARLQLEHAKERFEHCNPRKKRGVFETDS